MIFLKIFLLNLDDKSSGVSAGIARGKNALCFTGSVPLNLKSAALRNFLFYAIKNMAVTLTGTAMLKICCNYSTGTSSILNSSIIQMLSPFVSSI